MKHSTALSQRQSGNSDCTADLIYLYNGFWDDVPWGVYYCPVCDQIICCVDAGVHWWNYTSTTPAPQNLAAGREKARQMIASAT